MIATSSNTVSLTQLGFQTYSFTATVSTTVQPTEIAYVFTRVAQGSAGMTLAVDFSNPYAGSTVYATDVGVTGSYFTAQSEDACGTLTVTPAAVPEPPTAVMPLGALLGLAFAKIAASTIRRAMRLGAQTGG